MFWAKQVARQAQGFLKYMSTLWSLSYGPEGSIWNLADQHPLRSRNHPSIALRGVFESALKGFFFRYFTQYPSSTDLTCSYWLHVYALNLNVITSTHEIGISITTLTALKISLLFISAIIWDASIAVINHSQTSKLSRNPTTGRKTLWAKSQPCLSRIT